MPLDLDPIRKRLEQTESLFWENDCRDLEDMCEADLAFISNAPAYVAALLAEVESLRVELKAAQSSLSYVKEDRRQIQVTLDNLRYRIEKHDIYPRDTF